MKTSTSRILTSHTGSLPRPRDLVDLLNLRENGQPYDQATYDARIKEAIASIVKKQADTGLDIVNDGEHSKVTWMSYARTRLSGLEELDVPNYYFKKTTRDAQAFPGSYEDFKMQLAARTLMPKRKVRPTAFVCAAPIKYVGEAEVRTDIANLKAALEGVKVEDVFVTAISVSNLEQFYENKYYKSDDEYLAALGDAMNVEYKAIVDAGFVVQIDDPRMCTYYNTEPTSSVEDSRKFIARRVEALNHSLRGIPEDRVRFHTCYGVNIAPRVHDLELKHFVDLMLKVKAQAYVIEGANPRHEHEWAIWKDVKLPDNKVLVPGVVSHCVHLVEHPELVAQRIQRYADVVGRERVIASTDCGFGTSGAGDEVHPEIAWAKLQALVEGARLASERLWGKKAA